MQTVFMMLLERRRQFYENPLIKSLFSVTTKRFLPNENCLLRIDFFPQCLLDMLHRKETVEYRGATWDHIRSVKGEDSDQENEDEAKRTGVVDSSYQRYRCTQ